jgi:hypothetical protein
MNNVCPTPGCGGAYNLTLQHVGKRFLCRKCAAPLVVTDYGLQFDTAVAPGTAAPAAEMPAVFQPSPEVVLEPQPPARTGPPLWQKILTRMREMADVPTWLFASGAFLVIVYLFFPLIDQAKVTRREAAVIAGDVREARLDAELKKKENASDEEKERRKKGREAWEKEKSYLEEDLEAAQIGQRRATYWYRYFTMLGFILLTFGSLGYLSPGQPLIRRILGCIVLVAILLSIFNAFSGLGIRVDIGGR